MSALPGQQKGRSPFAAVAHWWREWTRSDLAELRLCGDEGIKRIAEEAGMAPAELLRLARKGRHAADLLLPRMKALGLDPDEVARTEPQTLHDMQRLCSMCASHGRCARDLSRNPTDPAWKDYCPNAGTLDALDKQPWAARSEW